MVLSINQWNEITETLNGYVLDYIVDDESYIYGVNSQGEKFLLASPSGQYWAATSGRAYEAIDDLLREVKSRIKASKDFSRENKAALLKVTFEEAIKLHGKRYV